MVTYKNRMIIGMSAWLCLMMMTACDKEKTSLTSHLSSDSSLMNIFDATSLVVENGYTSTSQVVAKIDGCDSFQLDIVSGEATFTDGSTSVSVEACEVIRLPEIRPGNLDDESILTISSQKQQKSTRLRIATIEEGNVNAFEKMVGDTSNAIAFRSDHVALVNENQLFPSDNAILAISDLQGKVNEKGVCVRAAWGPGKVNWKFSNPKSSGYSVKPESSSALRWAQTPSQDIDGVYRSSWGNCTALKVPDSCTVTYTSSSSRSDCCNAAMLALGHKVQWINPCSLSDWPDSPLR